MIDYNKLLLSDDKNTNNIWQKINLNTTEIYIYILLDYLLTHTHTVYQNSYRSGIADIRSDQWPSLPQLTYIRPGTENKFAKYSTCVRTSQCNKLLLFSIHTDIYFLMSVTNHNGIAANKNNIAWRYLFLIRFHLPSSDFR